MNSGIQALLAKSGTYEGFGINHEGQRFKGALILTPRVERKGVSLDFSATGDDGAVFHKEHSLVGLTPRETASLWVLSNNHPGVVEHQLVESEAIAGVEWSLCFAFGDQSDRNAFRETITIDLWASGEISYRYAWGMPGGEFAERSSVKMVHGRNQDIPEAKLKTTEHGLAPDGDGWYVINAQDARWYKNEKFGESCGFEGNRRFEQYGINIHVINPGQPNCHYHGEDDQEDFLVLSGECKLLIEGQERLLKEWDFVHRPKWARHVFVGAGNKPCAILMVGGADGAWCHLSRNRLSEEV